MKRHPGGHERSPGRGGATAVLERREEPQEEATPARSRAGAGWELAALVALIALAAAIRLYRLTALSLWEDEGFTAYVASEPLSSIFKWCGIDAAPPLYYLLLHFWVLLFPGEFGLRLFSVLCGVAAIPLIYLCGRSAHSSRAGLLAALLLSLNASHVHFSQEARYYALYFAASLLALYCTLELAKRPARGLWIGWVGSAALLLLCHSTAALYLIALTGLMATLRPGLQNPIWRGWWKAHAVLAALLLPVGVLLARESSGLAGHYFPPPPTLLGVADTALQMATVPFASWDATMSAAARNPRLLALPFFALAVWALFTRGQWATRPAIGILLFGLGAWALFFGISVAHSLYILRVLIPVIGALLLVGAIVLASAADAGRRAAAGVLLGLMLVSGALSLHLYYRDTRKQEIRDAVTYMLQHASDGDAAALVQHRFRWAIAYYLRGRSLPLVPVNLYQFTDPSYDTAGLTPDQAAAELRKASSLWIFELDHPDSEALNRQTEAWLATFLHPIERKSFYGVRLLRFAPTAR